jgi:alanyl-tRNA synthetase
MYEIDVMFPVIEKAQELTGRAYGANHEDDVRFRVVADHVRSSLMLIGDGVTPGQRGPRLRAAPADAPRRSARCGCSAARTRCCPSCSPVSRDKMGETYDGLHRDWERISTVAYAEEDAFRQTLRGRHHDLRHATPR